MRTGRRVGVYEIQTLLGAGGMGEVYRARDTKLRRDVAIKILPRAFTADPDRVARFEREARMLAALNHPNIATIHGFEESDGICALVLELVEGETLADKLARTGGLRLEETLNIARQIVDALDAAHERGIIHRDLKPANISITPDGVVKVLDFGLAKTQTGAATEAESRAQTVDETREGVVLGTAAYMSPEQARGQSVDKRTDIWAFGCVVYEMFTGRAAFARHTISDTIAAILEHEADWTALPAHTPAGVQRLLRRCLEKDLRRRLRDIADAALELEGAGETRQLSPVVQPSSNRWRWLAAAAAVIALSAVPIAWLSRSAGVPANPLAEARFTRFTDFDGAETDASISRDGRFVAFRSDRDGVVDTWVSQVGTGRLLNLTHGSQTVVLVDNVGFTPDGSEVWLSGVIGGARLRLMPISGGNARSFLTEHAMNVAWSPDGDRLVFQSYDAGDPMFVSDTTGANARQIYVAGAGVHNHFPVWSTDGRWIYFVSGSWDTREMDVWRISPSGGMPERLTHLNADVKYLAPLDARTVLCSAPDEDGAGPWLWALDTEANTSRRVSSGLERYTSVEASGNGRRLVATVSDPTANLWTIPLLDRQVHDTDVRPLSLPSGRAFAPRYGGDALFYLSSRGGGDGLWRFLNDEVTEIWRGVDGALMDPPAPSPDGRRLAVLLRKQGKGRLMTLSSEGGDVRTLTDALDVTSAASWSPDGQWIAASGTDAKGQGLFTIPAGGGPPVRLKDGPTFNPVWSSDGSVIAYTEPIAARMGRVRLVHPDGEAVETLLMQVSVGGERYRFVPGRPQLVYMLDTNSTKQTFWIYDMVSKTTRQLADFDMRGTRTFDINPDGTRIVFDRLRENSDIVLIDLPDPGRRD
jgi:Tol biopolymer transport system component